MNFEEELAKGNFMISTCTKCELPVWPPNDICSRCFSEVKWEKCSEVGKVVEFSQKDDTYFCLAEFEKDVRIMGIISGTEPKIDQKIRLVKVNIQNGNYHFEMKPLES